MENNYYCNFLPFEKKFHLNHFWFFIEVCFHVQWVTMPKVQSLKERLLLTESIGIIENIQQQLK